MWYYAENGQRKGPIEEAQLRDLANQGLIEGRTLVWTQGMANWSALADTTLGASLGLPPPLGPAPRPMQTPQAGAPLPPLAASGPYSSGPQEPLPVADKERVVYVLLAILLPFGVNNFYAGYTSRAIIQLILAVPAGVLTCGITSIAVWIWSIIEAITVTHDARGRQMR
jgi:TM2 domain-containing membrane protein YozV